MQRARAGCPPFDLAQVRAAIPELHAVGQRVASTAGDAGSRFAGARAVCGRRGEQVDTPGPPLERVLRGRRRQWGDSRHGRSGSGKGSRGGRGSWDGDRQAARRVGRSYRLRDRGRTMLTAVPTASCKSGSGQPRQDQTGGEGRREGRDFGHGTHALSGSVPIPRKRSGSDFPAFTDARLCAAGRPLERQTAAIVSARKGATSL